MLQGALPFDAVDDSAVAALAGWRHSGESGEGVTPHADLMPPGGELSSLASPPEQSVPMEAPALHVLLGDAPSAPFVVRSKRARRYILRVQGDGSVRVTVPRWGTKRDALQFVERQHAWIDKQREKIQTARVVRQEPPMSATDQRELQARARRELPSRLLTLAQAFELTVSRISIRNQRWRWGSCSRDGHICLNWRLVAMPEWVRDYVLIHELMHLKRMDHSPRFWKLVAAACPSFREARAWLRTNQHMLDARV